jgi:hypothetical protein
MKLKLEKESRLSQVDHDINQPLIFLEPHIGEATWVNKIYDFAISVQKKLKAKNVLSGDLLNADDLRTKGILSKENIQDQMYEFREYFLPFPVLAILQNNHGTRMFGKNLPRQFGESLVSKWSGILDQFKERNPGIKILEPDEVVFELHLYDEGKCVKKGLVWHPVGSSPEVFSRRIAQTVQDFDFHIVFHFHRNLEIEITKMCPNGYYDVSKVKFVSPIIENPRYGVGKYPPINSGFLVVRKQRDDLTDKTNIVFKEYTKADIVGG